MNARRLYRCRHDRQLAGVAGGLAEYLDLDPTLVRVLWILSVFFGGFTILLYIVLAFVMPLEPVPMAAGPVAAATQPGPVAGSGTVAGSDAADAAGLVGSVASDPTATTATATWVAPGGAAVPAAWAAPAAHAHTRRGDGRFGLVVGVVLVVFGALALVGPLFPGWALGAAFWPAFLLAVGVGLLVVAARRPAPGA